MENIHIRLEHSESVFAKKELLNSEINSLQALKAFKNFKSIRKRELIYKTRLKKSLFDLKTGIEEIEKVLPTEKEEEPQLKFIKKLSKKNQTTEEKMTKPEKKEYKEIEKELLEIREKLMKLS
jgi:hypothetical protein